MREISKIGIILIFIIVGCGTNSNSENKYKTEYDKKVEQELSSGAKNNDIFLSFRLGDSKGTVSTKLNNLNREGKISLNDNGKYVYEFAFDENDVLNGYATISTHFHNNSLYEFSMTVNPSNFIMHTLAGRESKESLQNYYMILQSNLATLFMNKYGEPIKFNNYYDTNNYFWIDGNREIRISLGDRIVNIVYIDLPVIDKIIEEEKIRNAKKAIGKKADI